MTKLLAKTVSGLVISTILLTGMTILAQDGAVSPETRPAAAADGRASELVALRDDLAKIKAALPELSPESAEPSPPSTLGVQTPQTLTALELILEQANARISRLEEHDRAQVPEQSENNQEPKSDILGLQRVEWLILVAIALGLVNLAFLWRRLPAGARQTQITETKVPVPPSPLQPPKAPVVAGDESNARERREAKSTTVVAKAPRVDEFEAIPHGRIGRLLGQMQEAAGLWSPKLSEVRGAERFVRDLGAPLGARIQRFKEAALRGDSYLERHWLEQDLVTTLNTLSELLSVAIEERHQGGRVGRSVEGELRHWLYERLAPACREEGFFVIEEILPFTTRFDAKIHRAVETKSIEGAENLVVGIKLIGRRDARSKELTHKAEVVVGR